MYFSTQLSLILPARHLVPAAMLADADRVMAVQLVFDSGVVDDAAAVGMLDAVVRCALIGHRLYPADAEMMP